MIKPVYVKSIAARLQIRQWQVENCVTLFEEGATIPFISRYRKERTGGLDDVAVAEVRHWTDVFNELEKRKETVLDTISQAGVCERFILFTKCLPHLLGFFRGEEVFLLQPEQQELRQPVPDLRFSLLFGHTMHLLL